MRNETEKILGIMWNYKKDTFNVKYSDESNPNNKRRILSHITSKFDPLSLPLILSLVFTRAKTHHLATLESKY